MIGMRARLVAAALLWLAPAVALAKLPEGISLSVEVGYNGWVQTSRVNPVIVDLENQSQSLNLSGELVLDYNGTEYVTPLALPRPSKKRFFLYFPCDSYPPYLVLRIRTKQYTEEFDLTQQFKVMQGEDTSIMVLTSQGGSLGVVNQMPTVRLERDLYRDDTASLGSGKTMVSYYDVARVDSNPKFFSRADVIVLGDIDYQQVTPQLAQALEQSVAGGAGLVFSLGLHGMEVAKSPLKALCPINPERTVQLASLGDFGRLYRIPAGAVATFAAGQAMPGAAVLAWANGLPAVIERRLGGGRVIALAFDFTAVPFRQNPALAAMFSDFVLRVGGSASADTWYIHPGHSGKILQGLSEAEPMRPQWVFLFVLAYVVLIGPVNFLVLSWLKRRTLVWTTIPLIILVFSWIGLFTGYLTRGSNNVCAYIEELHIYPGAAYAPYQTAMLVFTAERTRYRLEVPDESAFLFPDVPQEVNEYAFGAARTGQLRGLSGSQLDNTRLPVVTTTQGKWTAKEYFYQGFSASRATVESHLVATRAGGKVVDLRGSLKLALPFNLDSAYIVTGAEDWFPVGNLAGKKDYELAGRTPLGNLPDTLPPENYLVKDIPTLSEDERQAAACALDYRHEALLVGFTDELQRTAKFAKPHNEYRLALVVIHLPCEEQVMRTGAPVVSRPLIVGGQGFVLDRQMAYMRSAGAEQYSIAANGYVEVAFEISGDLAQSTRLLLHVEGFSSSNRNPISDLSTFARAEVWTGAGWQQVPVRPNETALEVPFAGALDNSRRIRIRLRATADFTFGLPWAEVY